MQRRATRPARRSLREVTTEQHTFRGQSIEVRRLHHRVPRGTETVLLAEDESQVRETMRIALEGAGYTVIGTQSSSEAMQVGQERAGTIHLLITEPEVGTPSTVMQVLKQRAAHALLPKRKRRDARQRKLFGDEAPRRAFWQARFYDFNVWTTKKRVEKLRYMHRNPVKRGLVESTEQWRGSSYRFYLLGEVGPVRVNEGWTEISFCDRVANAGTDGTGTIVSARRRR